MSRYGRLVCDCHDWPWNDDRVSLLTEASRHMCHHTHYICRESYDSPSHKSSALVDWADCQRSILCLFRSRFRSPTVRNCHFHSRDYDSVGCRCCVRRWLTEFHLRLCDVFYAELFPKNTRRKDESEACEREVEWNINSPKRHHLDTWVAHAVGHSEWAFYFWWWILQSRLDPLWSACSAKKRVQKFKLNKFRSSFQIHN